MKNNALLYYFAREIRAVTDVYSTCETSEEASEVVATESGRLPSRG